MPPSIFVTQQNWQLRTSTPRKPAANEFAVPEGWDDQWAQRMLLSKMREAVQTSYPHRPAPNGKYLILNVSNQSFGRG